MTHTDPDHGTTLLQEEGAAEDVPAQPTESAPVAVVAGAPVHIIPDDLYIPPEALRVLLQAFEGPLDLLLYLIKHQNLDILALPIHTITQQYLDYIHLMDQLNIQLAGEYLLMAATLAEIKSRFLLPRPELEEGETEELLDPRAELIRRLQVYECFKNAAERLGELPRLERDVYLVDAEKPTRSQEQEAAEPEVSIQEVMLALSSIMKRASLVTHHKVVTDKLTVRDRMTHILHTLDRGDFVLFTTLFTVEEGRVGVVVTLIAILEMVRESILVLTQDKPFSPIYVKMKEETPHDDH